MNKKALLEKICNSKTPEEAWRIIVNEWNYIHSLQDASEEWWDYRTFLSILIKIFKEALKVKFYLEKLQENLENL